MATVSSAGPYPLSLTASRGQPFLAAGGSAYGCSGPMQAAIPLGGQGRAGVPTLC